GLGEDENNRSDPFSPSTGDNNQLTSDGTYTYTYDDEGNVLTRSKTDETTTYEWDHRNRLTRVIVTTGSSTTTITFRYDAANRLVTYAKTVVQGMTTNVLLRWYVYDGNQ